MSPVSSGGPYFVVLDVDSTLIENEAIELLAEAAGSYERVAEITSRAMAGELDFTESLRERVSTLAGLPEKELETVARKITVTRGVRELIGFVQSHGGQVCAVSGGFHELLDPIAEKLGVNFWAANRLEKRDGVLTGNLVGPIIDARAKAEHFTKWLAASQIDPARSVAIGDGANDLLMMKQAGLSIAFCAKPIVREQAHISIDERDMNLVVDVLVAHS